MEQTVEDSGEFVGEPIQPVIVEDDAVNRCQHSKVVNQCKFSTIKGQVYCQYHIALHVASFRKQNRLKKYKLFRHHARINEMVGSPEISNLAEEVGILQYTLETLMNQCHTPWDIQVNQHKIESLIEKIQKTMVVSHKLQAAMGKVLGRTALAAFVDDIAKIISEENLAPEVLARISARIGESLQKAEDNAKANSVLAQETTEKIG